MQEQAFGEIAMLLRHGIGGVLLAGNLGLSARRCH